MQLRTTDLLSVGTIISLVLAATACSGGEDYPRPESGGSSSTNTGGSSTGGVTGSGGASSFGGFTASGGTTVTGGTSSATGGAPTGGFTSQGGSSSGGTGFGKGGSSSGGGSAKGGTSSGRGGSSAGGKGGSGNTTGGTSFGKGGTTFGTGGTSTGTGGSSGSTVTFKQVADVIQKDCGSCHAAQQRPTLSSSNLSGLYTTLTTTKVTQCGGDAMVTANDPSNSALIEVVTGKCGTLRMPTSCTAASTSCIPAADLQTITDWIQQGAKNQ